jgi:hypothetical protein
MAWFKKKAKKVDAAPADPLAALSAGLNGALRSIGAVAQEGRGTARKAADAEECRAWLKAPTAEAAGFAAHVSSSQAVASLFFPASLLRAGTPTGHETVEAFAAAWAKGFPPPFSNAFSYGLPAPSPDPDAALWPFLDLECYEVEVAGQKAWLFIETGLRIALTEASEGAKEPQAERASAPISIARPRDFMALEALAPKALVSGTARFNVEPESFRFAPGAEATEGLAGAETAWYLASFDLAQAAENRKLTVIYAFQKPPPRPQGPDPEAAANALAAALFQESLKAFARDSGATPSNPGMKRLPAPPDLSKAGTVLALKAVAVGSALKMSFSVVSPAGVLLGLYAPFLDSAAVKRLSARPESLVLALNAQILSSRLAGMLSPPELRERAPHLLVSELLNHLSDADYGLVLQNCLISSLGAKELPPLFYYNDKATGPDGAARERVLPMGPVDARRLFAHMPEAFREDFAANYGRLRANQAELCLSRNVEALKGIASAVAGGRIASGPRLAWLLREFFLKVVRAREEAELEGLKASDLPFAQLESLPSRAAQKVMARIGDRDAALALLDRPEKNAAVGRFVSRSRWARLAEERAFLKRAYESGELGPEELLRAKRLIADTCDEVKRVEEQEALSDRERKRAGPSVREPAQEPLRGRTGRRA